MKIAAATLALLALARPATETLEFAPAQGLVLEKRFEIHMLLSKRSLTMSIDGREMPAGMTASAELEMDSQKTIVVRDAYEKVEGARPLQLVRRYETLKDVKREKTRMPGMPVAQEGAKEQVSKLTGKTVEFRWNDARARYDAAWVGKGADDRFLQGVAQDMDLSRLVTGKRLFPGEEWRVDERGFAGFLGAAGNLGFQAPGEKSSQFDDNLKGEAICAFEGVEFVDGRRLALVRVSCELRSFSENVGDRKNIRMDVEMNLSGEFRWDVGAKHLDSYALDGDIAARMTVTDSIQVDDDQLDVLVKADLAGRCEVRGRFARR
jgi:hypothetical protein